MQPTIIAIVGASGSGKTYLSKLLQDELNVFSIISHTTRPKRTDETHGKDYYFIRNIQIFPFCDMLTHTKFGGYEYFALRDQVPPEGYCTYVVDESGVQALKKLHGHRFRIVTVLVRSNYETLAAAVTMLPPITAFCWLPGASTRSGFSGTEPVSNCRKPFMIS